MSQWCTEIYSRNCKNRWLEMACKNKNWLELHSVRNLCESVKYVKIFDFELSYDYHNAKLNGFYISR